MSAAIYGAVRQTRRVPSRWHRLGSLPLPFCTAASASSALQP
jgi:hypothetical protein